MNKLQKAGLIAILMLLSQMGKSEEIQSIASIKNTVKKYLSTRISNATGETRIFVGKLDPRLRLQQCDSSLTPFSPAHSKNRGNTTVGVKCYGKTPWTIYVPVSIKVYDKVMVTAHPLARGQIITQNDFILEERDLSLLNQGYFNQPSQLIGKKLKRSIPIGFAVSPNMITTQKLVKRGQRVVLFASQGGIVVRMSGTALMDGTAGDFIRARNNRSKRVVEGKVTSSGVISVVM